MKKGMHSVNNEVEEITRGLDQVKSVSIFYNRVVANQFDSSSSTHTGCFFTEL